MKRILPILILIFASIYLTVPCFAIVSQEKIIFISKDSIKDYPNYIVHGWKYIESDDSTMSQLSYNDSQWITVNSMLNLSSKSTPEFNSICWMRLHFKTDSTVTGRPIALSIEHYGASQIYLDGKLIQSYGKINGKDSSLYIDPEELPFVIIIPDGIDHVIAVRYANYNARRYHLSFIRQDAGFKMMIGETETLIYNYTLRNTIITLIFMLLIGFFFAFCLIHFFMYLLNKSIRSNLYFSIFVFSLAAEFLCEFISFVSTSPKTLVVCNYSYFPLFVLLCLSLSGFINELFNKRKLRFIILSAVGILTIIIRFLNLSIFLPISIGLIIAVSFEAVFCVIFAIIKKVRGARIIGTGILFFALFVLTLFTLNLLIKNFDINDTTVGGQILLFLLALAIISIPLSMSIYLAWNFSYINKNLAVQLDQVKLLSQKTLEQESEKQRMLENKKDELEKEVLQRTSELRDEKKKSDDLLLNILPADVAEELKNKGSAEARDYEMVTVMFSDFKDFTRISEQLTSTQLVEEINYCFSAFDNIIHKYGVEKIKTIGDAYMCAGGLPIANKTHAEDTVKAALEIRDFMTNHNKEKLANRELPFEVRIGINTGPVVAGIVGVKKFAYDIWGDTVNLASRMESSGEAGKVNISGSTYELVKDKFTCTHRGKIETKNKGEVDMYFVS